MSVSTSSVWHYLCDKLPWPQGEPQPQESAQESPNGPRRWSWPSPVRTSWTWTSSPSRILCAPCTSTLQDPTGMRSVFGQITHYSQLPEPAELLLKQIHQTLFRKLDIFSLNVGDKHWFYQLLGLCNWWTVQHYSWTYMTFSGHFPAVFSHGLTETFSGYFTRGPAEKDPENVRKNWLWYLPSPKRPL